MDESDKMRFAKWKNTVEEERRVKEEKEENFFWSNYIDNILLRKKNEIVVKNGGKAILKWVHRRCLGDPEVTMYCPLQIINPSDWKKMLVKIADHTPAVDCWKLDILSPTEKPQDAIEGNILEDLARLICEFSF